MSPGIRFRSKEIDRNSPLSFSARFFSDRPVLAEHTDPYVELWRLAGLPASPIHAVPTVVCYVRYNRLGCLCVCVRVALMVCCVPHTHLSRCVAFWWEARNVCWSPPPSFGLFVCVRARSCVSLLPISPLVWCFLLPFPPSNRTAVRLPPGMNNGFRFAFPFCALLVVCSVQFFFDCFSSKVWSYFRLGQLAEESCLMCVRSLSLKRV